MFHRHRLAKHLYDSVAVAALRLHLLQASQIPLPAHTSSTLVRRQECVLLDLFMHAGMTSLTMSPPALLHPASTGLSTVDLHVEDLVWMDVHRISEAEAGVVLVALMSHRPQSLLLFQLNLLNNMIRQLVGGSCLYV